MDKATLFSIIGVVILLAFIVWRLEWFPRLRRYWKIYRVVSFFRLLKQWREHYDSPEGKLERAREAVSSLRRGYWLNQYKQTIYLRPETIEGYIDDINTALEAGCSYNQIGTTRDEVIGFRNGEAHRTAARLELAIFRTLEQGSREYQIRRLVEAGHFALEEIGSREEEIEALDREIARRLYATTVDHFRRWARTGESVFHKDPDEFEKQLAHLLSPKPDGYGFSYEEMETGEAECAELMRLARRREVERWINHLRHETGKGVTNNDITRKFIAEALEKAGLTLADFGLTEADIDEMERQAHIVKAGQLLTSLRTPGEDWFCSWKESILGDPVVFLKEIEEHLADANKKANPDKPRPPVTLETIGTSEGETSELVREGHVFSARFLLEGLERISQTPRRTKYEVVRAMLGPKAMVWDSPSNPIDRMTLEDPYPVERTFQAIEYHLAGAGISLQDLGSSPEKLQELRAAIEAR